VNRLRCEENLICLSSRRRRARLVVALLVEVVVVLREWRRHRWG